MVEATPQKPVKRAPKPKVKTDPRLVSAARELRDRWLERVNDDPSAILGLGKYDVSRAIEDRASVEFIGPAKLLAA